MTYSPFSVACEVAAKTSKSYSRSLRSALLVGAAMVIVRSAFYFARGQGHLGGLSELVAQNNAKAVAEQPGPNPAASKSKLAVAWFVDPTTPTDTECVPVRFGEQ